MKKENICRGIMVMMGKLMPFVILLMLATSTVQAADLKDGYITREKMMEIAEAYENHVWNPTADNIYHGLCNGNQVDTPDNAYSEGGWIPNQANTGIPYQWGGFSSIDGLDLINPHDFDQQIQNNFYAGDRDTVG
ncbi:MAG: hypothetical protein D4R88_01970, partial [Methanosarcinales archaeon]